MEFGCTAGFSNFIDGPDGVISTGLRLGVVEAKDTDALVPALHSDVLGRVDGFVVLVPLNLRGGFPLDHTVQFWGAQKNSLDDINWEPDATALDKVLVVNFNELGRGNWCTFFNQFLCHNAYAFIENLH